MARLLKKPLIIALAAVILLVIVIFAGSCACGKKTVKAPDAESQGVMKITPIPTATPTPVPRQVNKASGVDALRGNTRSHPEHDG